MEADKTSPVTKQNLDDLADEIKKSLCKYGDYARSRKYEKKIEKLSKQFINLFISYVQVNKMKSKEFEKLKENYFYDDIGYEDNFHGIVLSSAIRDFGYFGYSSLTNKMLDKDLSLFEISTVIYLIFELEILNDVYGHIFCDEIEELSSRVIDIWGPIAINKEIAEYAGNFGHRPKLKLSKCEFEIDNFILPRIANESIGELIISSSCFVPNLLNI